MLHDRCSACYCPYTTFAWKTCACVPKNVLFIQKTKYRIKVYPDDLISSFRVFTCISWLVCFLSFVFRSSTSCASSCSLRALPFELSYVVRSSSPGWMSQSTYRQYAMGHAPYGIGPRCEARSHWVTGHMLQAMCHWQAPSSRVVFVWAAPDGCPAQCAMRRSAELHPAPRS